MRGPARHPWAALTEREAQVARLIVDGLTNQQIATRLGMSENGVKSRVRDALKALGAYNRAHLVALLLGESAAVRAERVLRLTEELGKTGLDDGQRALVEQLRRLVTGRPL